MQGAACRSDTMDSRLLHDLNAALPRDGAQQSVLHEPEDLMLYEYDGSVELARPDGVVFPRTATQVVEIVKIANRHNVSLIGRGAGTGLSGGALARRGGIIVSFARMNQILEVDTANQRARVQPGVVNADLSLNAGGPHTLAYGVTTNHVLAIEVVLPTGEIVHLGSSALDPPGYDLAGLFVGSEGTFGLITEITVKLTRLPETIKTLLAAFDSVDDATETVVEITARGITPAACEMMDGWTIRAVEDYVHAGFPLDSAAILLIEVDGLQEAAESQAAQVAEVCRLHRAREVRVAKDSRERDLLWKGRKNAFGAVGRLSPTYYTQDGVIPRTKLPQTLRRISDIGRQYGFEIGNIFHAGDGNLHPIILFDARDKQQFQNAVAAAGDIIAFCVEVGGAITGEHGVGMEKDHLMPLLFSEADMALMQRVRDAFNPAQMLNPGKIFPSKSCGEIHVRPQHTGSGSRSRA